jgi:hemerythrin-like domain-containing protein
MADAARRIMPRPAKPTSPEEKLRRFMADSHRQLNELFDRLLAAMEANAPDTRELWNELDRGLHAHMEAEERYLLPRFARSHADEAAALLREHGQIREQLLELGVAVDLHCIRLDQSQRFIATLRDHAEREDRLLYDWADQQLERSVIEATHQHLTAG